jgi:hypothetical protein
MSRFYVPRPSLLVFVAVLSAGDVFTNGVASPARAQLVKVAFGPIPLVVAIYADREKFQIVAGSRRL